MYFQEIFVLKHAYSARFVSRGAILAPTRFHRHTGRYPSMLIAYTPLHSTGLYTSLMSFKMERSYGSHEQTSNTELPKHSSQLRSDDSVYWLWSSLHTTAGKVLSDKYISPAVGSGTEGRGHHFYPRWSTWGLRVIIAYTNYDRIPLIVAAFIVYSRRGKSTSPHHCQLHLRY